MGILSTITAVTKARATHGLMRRVLGGPLSTALIAAYLGKKAYDAYRRRRVVRYS